MSGANHRSGVGPAGKAIRKGFRSAIGSKQCMPVSVISTGSISHRLRRSAWVAAPRTCHRDFRSGIVRQNYLALQVIAEAQQREERRRSSTQSTRSTHNMRASSGWTWITYWCRSPITASRRSKSPGALVATGAIDVVVVDSWPPSSPKRNWKERWATATWGCTPA